jgi:mRNA-degrading endonuclease toxin of MazEF toxin-antitoxin module
LNFGDIVRIDFGTPRGSEAGFVRPGVIVVADSFLRYRPSTLLVVPLTSTPRTFPSHVSVEPDGVNQLDVSSCALVEQLRAVSVERCGPPTGNVGPVVSHQILEVLGMIVGMP